MNSHHDSNPKCALSNPNTNSSISTLTLSPNALYSKQNAILTQNLTLNLDSPNKNPSPNPNEF